MVPIDLVYLFCFEDWFEFDSSLNWLLCYMLEFGKVLLNMVRSVLNISFLDWICSLNCLSGDL